MAQVKFLEKTERYTSAPSGPAHENILANRLGYGANAQGGAGGPLVHVTNTNNTGAGSLRAALTTDDNPAWIVFDVSGTINLSTFIHMWRSNKTIDGRGQNITLSSEGIIIGWIGSPSTVPVSNIIIHNIKFQDVTGNGMIRIGQDASKVWVDHCTFQNASDEIIAIGSSGMVGGTSPLLAPHDITVSWNHFPAATPSAGWADKSLLISSDPSDTADVGITLTLHHNHYETFVRHPLARHAKIHAINNYYDGVDIGVDAVTDVQFYSENDIFRYAGGSNPMVKIWIGGTEGVGGNDPRGAANCKVANPLLITGATVEEINTSTIFNPASFYSYSPDAATTGTRDAVVAGAGWQDVALPS